MIVAQGFGLQIWETFLNNLPKEIGLAIAAIITGLVAWSVRRVKKIRGGGKKDTAELSAPTEATVARDVLADYVNDLIRRASTLAFGGPASWSAESDETAGLVTLEQLWTPLRVADSQVRVGKTGTHESMAEEDDGVALQELVSSSDDSVLILGDPGSGKSTSVAYFAVGAARKWASSKDKAPPLPIWVNLGNVSYERSEAPEGQLLRGVPEVDLAVSRSGQAAGDRLQALLRRAIVDGDALLLLDGLDEVPEHVLNRVRTTISRLLAARNGCRLIVTCRKFDYRQSSPRRKVPIERELELLPYSPVERNLYVFRWYQAAVNIGRFTPAEADDLSSALQLELRSQELAALAGSPLLLALLTLIHSEEAKLPDTRSVVCDRAIRYILADAARWRRRAAGASTTATPQVYSFAVEIAYRSHRLEEDDGVGDAGVTLALINEAAAEIAGSMARAEIGTPSVPTPEDLVHRILNSHGLLLDGGGGRFKFGHRYFQEFLAGQYFAVGAHREEAVKRGLSSHWREPFRLMASLAGHEGENLFYIFSLIDQLMAVSGEVRLPATQLAAEMLAEIGRRRIALRQFSYVLDEIDSAAGVEGLWRRVREAVARHVEDPALSLAERERSASVLGLLGDSRFVDPAGTVKMPWSSVVVIPASTAVVGSERLDSAPMVGGWVGDLRELEFGEYAIGRYPITNAQFSAFVHGDGYLNPDYWNGRFAKGWLSGDYLVLREMRDHWLSTVHDHHTKEIRDGEIDVARLEEEAERRTAPRQAPYYWGDRRFNQPNQPVVGVNYWEAAAFCEWSTANGRRSGALTDDQIIALPTEFEWERASREKSDDRIYPWGDHWVEAKAHVNSNVLNMRQPCPVGVHLEAWPGGPCDLAGNVWEWTSSLFLPYGEAYDASRFSDDSLAERVVRGSSWYNTQNLAACSARAVDRSYNLFYDVGFRVVLADARNFRR